MPEETIESQKSLDLKTMNEPKQGELDEKSASERTREFVEVDIKTNDLSEKQIPTSNDEINPPSGKSSPIEDNNNNNNDGEESVKCSAVNAFERGIAINNDYSHLVKELRVKICEEFESSPGIFSQIDIDKCRTDDWYLSRYLLRNKLNLDTSFDMLKKCLRFKHESMINSLRPQDFPAEFYKLGGLFSYGHDRKGNRMLYMRIRLHKKMPEIQMYIESFLFYNINRLDVEANGKGISIVLDCTDGGLANADMETLKFMISSLLNYFPKGLSYILVHNQPWILRPFWQIARLCIPDEYVQLVKFSNQTTIFEYVDKEELPDFLGGTSVYDYKKVPDNCTTLKQAAKLWGVEKEVVKRILMRFAEHLPPETIDEFDKSEELAGETS